MARDPGCEGEGGVRSCSLATCTAVIARLDRAIQYSRDVSDRTERPRRTGFPAFAGNDR